MTVTTMPSPPVLCDGTTYDAGILRRVWTSMLADIVGVLSDGALAPSIVGTTVTVAPGLASLPSPPTETGTYLVEALSATPFSLTPADATRSRIDCLFAYPVPPVNPEDTGTWVIELVDGEPSATPVAPTVSSALWVAEILVPSAASSLPPSVTDRRASGTQQVISGPTSAGLVKPPSPRTGQVWTDRTTRRVWVFDGVAWNFLDGVLPVDGPSGVTSPTVGKVIYDRAADRLKRWTGSTWLDPVAWKSYTPTWSAATTSPTLGNGKLSGEWARIGDTVHVRIALTFGSTTTGGSGSWSFAPPVPSVYDTNHTPYPLWLGTALLRDVSAFTYVTGVAFVSSGQTIGVLIDNTQLSGSGPFTFASGDHVSLTLSYRAA